MDMPTISVFQTLPVLVEVLINKKKVLMKVDTCASCSVMSLTKFKELDQLQDLKENLVKLRTYTSELVKPYGRTEVKVLYEGMKNCLPFLVVKGDMPMLLGQN